MGSYILTILLLSMIDVIASTYFQRTIKRLEVIQEVSLSEIHQLDDFTKYVINKK